MMVDSLRRVPGIGKKTAERLIVELRDIVGSLPAEAGQAAGAGLSGDDDASLCA